MITFFMGNRFNAVNGQSKKVIYNFRNNKRNRFAFLFPETAGERINLVVQFIRFGNDPVFCGNADFMAVT